MLTKQPNSIMKVVGDGRKDAVTCPESIWERLGNLINQAMNVLL